MKFLIVEDDQALADMLKEGLRAESHVVEVAADGADGSFLGRSYAYDAIILDYSLPKKNGLEVAREIRASGRETPIIFLSVVDDAEIKVKAFENGADDFMTKPFSMKELWARIKAINSRKAPSLAKNDLLCIYDLALDVEKHEVRRGDAAIKLTRKEFGMLEFMMRNIGRVLSRAVIMEHVWTADSDMLSNTVEAHVRNLRLKLNAGNKANLIGNIPGRGYIIDTPEKLKNL